MKPAVHMFPLFFVFLVFAAWNLPVISEDVEDPSLLTVDRIFASDEFDARSPRAIRWLEHGSGYTTFENAKGEGGGKDLVWHDPESGEEEVLIGAHEFRPDLRSGPLSIDEHHWAENGSKLLLFTNSRRVWRSNTRGDYWVFDLSSRELLQVGADFKPSSLMFAKFSPDARRVAYVHKSNLYVEDLRGVERTQLTFDGGHEIINGTFDWVYEEEFHLRDGFRWSPDGTSIAYWQLDTAGVRDFYLIDNTAGLYPEITAIPYPKTGQTNSAARIGVVSAGGGETRWMQVPGDPREHYIAQMDWAPEGGELILQQLNRLQNTNRVMLADAQSGNVRALLTETDDAWVDVYADPIWLDDGANFTWASERDGWRRVYAAPRDGSALQAVTPEGMDAIEVLRVIPETGAVYFIASPDNPTQRYLYLARLDGGEARRLTPMDQPGTHEYSISPDGQFAVHTFSSFAVPPVSNLIRLPGHTVVRESTNNKKLQGKLKNLTRGDHEFFRVPIGGGVELDAYCMFPPELDASKQYPMLFHVYGEPWGQTVKDRWGGDSYLWHLMHTQRGYLVMSVDNRGTNSPRGRDFRKVVYRKIGQLNAQDQADALRAILDARPYIDPDRVAVWGWSGGGSMSLNLIFQYPKLYHVAMSVAPVAVQRYYDTIYQERYMGLPEDNTEGYRLGSPITHAHKLEGELLIVHGTGDDNVHFQGTEALINELVAHNKRFTMMAYPNRSHGIGEGPNTTRHLYTLLTEYLYEHLPSQIQ